MLPSGVAFAQDQEADDEIIVTGSYIRRGNFDTPTPLNIVDQADILEQGSPNITDVIRQQTFNYGTDFQANRAANTNQGGSNTAANLRGLGEAATLTLLNGKRSVTGDITRMYPLIAIQRIETLLDGAAALYGSDAVAGVVNFIPFTDYEGMKIQIDGQWDDDFSHDQYNIAALWGAGNDTTSLVMAFSYFDRADLDFLDRPRNSSVGFGTSSTANPGNFQVFLRDQAGDPIPAATRGVDPECANPNVGDVDNFFDPQQPAAGILFGSCRFNFQSPYQYVPDDERLQLYGHVSHDITDNLQFNFEMIYNHKDTVQNGSLTDPGRLNFTIPGENPGSIFRAVAPNQTGVDTDGDAIFGTPKPLFGQDFWNNDNLLDLTPDGIADRDPGVDLDQNGFGDVILAANRFASINDDPDGGIPFMQDTNGVDVRTIGNLGPFPSFGVTEQGGTFQSNTFDDIRVVGELRYEIPNSNWLWTGSYLLHRSTFNNVFGDISKSRVIAAINCEGGPNGDLCFNPFANHIIPDSQLQNNNTSSNPGISVVAPATTLAERENSQEIVDWIFISDLHRTETVLNVVDTVFSGDLFDASWAGDRSVGVAVGGQWRRERFDFNGSVPFNKGDRLFFGQADDFVGSRDVYSVFGELALPLFDSDTLGSAELQAAVRYEDFGDGINTTDPKFAVLWQPIDTLSLRASWGQAFVAPSLGQLGGPVVFGLQNIPDRIAKGASDPGGFLQTPIPSNANLVPETSENFNIGFSWELIEDLTLSADYWDFDFTDRLVVTGSRDILTPDEELFLDLGGVFGNNADAIAWAGGTPSANISAADAAQASPLVTRDPISGVILQIERPRVNAAFFETAGLDFGVAWRFDADTFGLDQDIGTFNWKTDVTWVESFNFAANEFVPIKDGVGQQNAETNIAVPIPEWRINSTISWTYGDRHSASITGRWYSEVQQDSGLGPLHPLGFAECAPPGAGCTGTNKKFADTSFLGTGDNPDGVVNAQATFDVQYTYRTEGLVFDDDRQTAFTIGAINVLDNKPPKISDFGGAETFLNDIRNRMWYFRIEQDV